MCCILGAIITKSPLKNIERITPNIYNVDIGGYLCLFQIKRRPNSAIDSIFHETQWLPTTKLIHYDLADK